MAATETQTNYAAELDFAKSLALEAGKIMLSYFDHEQHVTLKSDGTAVTVADTIINQLVIDRIAHRFPSDGVVGEEASTTGYGSGRRWICDPIDGTAPFIYGLPTSMFSLCLVIDGKPTVAVANDPQRRSLYWSIRGQGAHCGDRRLHVSAATFDAGAVGLAPEYIRGSLITLPFLQKLIAKDKRLAIFDGAVFRGCLVAEGRLAGYPHPRVKPWDIAAVHLIIEEAGGKVTSVSGEPLDYSKPFQGAVLSNGVAHDNLLALFKS